ncbi:MAG TPA: ABC transporter substrate-binding protein [Candidatus Acidoferrales bacterium]|nr:ABC transporter substrate-binding protein [Candidatus Acidoferrales bacterium]
MSVVFRARAVAALFVLALFVAEMPKSVAQTEAPGSMVTGDTIVIGQYADQSGPNAPVGASKYGLDAYFSMVNHQGGIAGKKLKLISYDDSYKPAETLALVKKLVYDDQVFAIAGGVGSPTTAAVTPMLNSAGVPLIGMTSGSPIFSEPTLKYIFPVWPLYTTDGKTMGAFVHKNFAGKKVGVIYQDDAFGKPVLAGITQTVGTIDVSIPYVPSQVDFSQAIAKLKASDVGVVILATLATTAAQILNEMPKLAYAPVRVMTASACGYASIFTTIPSLNGAYCAAFLPPPGSAGPQWTQFSKAMATYEPERKPEIYSAWGWLAAEVTVSALKRIKGPITRDAFVKALDETKNLQTLGGDLSYTPDDHKGICCMFMWQATGDHWSAVPGSTFNGLSGT